MRAAAVLGLALLLSGCRPALQGNGRNLLLVTLETTRADHLSLHGYGRQTSPALARFAARAAVFEAATSVSPRTNPSLATLLTSRFPHEHGVRNLLLPLEPENRTLAEVLRDAGYRTGAIQTHPRLVRGSGLEQGFSDYLDDFRDHPLADQACSKAAAWIERANRKGRPWHLWIHLMDPHWTYDPPASVRTAFAPDDPRPARLYADLAARRRTIGPVIFRNTMPPDEVAAFVALYDAEILHTDRALGALLDRLAADGTLERTVVASTADHGESLGEHDYIFEPGDLGTQAEIHVPLVLAAPAGAGVTAGSRTAASVSTLDLAPTLLELLQVPTGGTFRGRSLLPVLAGAEGDRSCFGETDRAMHEENTRREVEGVAGKWRWIRRGPFKLMHRPRAGGTAGRALYDLAADPGETVDVSAAHREVADRLGRELEAWLSEDSGEEREYHITDEAREILRSLGYVN